MNKSPLEVKTKETPPATQERSEEERLERQKLLMKAARKIARRIGSSMLESNPGIEKKQ